MNLEEILQELDGLFEQNRISEVEAFLRGNIDKALEQKSFDIAISLLNELMGFFRETGQKEKSYACIDTVTKLMEELGLKDTVHYGITMVNAANAYRAAGDFEKSLWAYGVAEEIYKKSFAPEDGQFAAFYNNLSLLYQEMGDFQGAKENLQKSLHIITKQENAELEQAVTHTNLANTLLQIGETTEAKKHLEEALSLMETNDIRDVHYCGALSSYGSLLFMEKQYEEAADTFLKAAERIKVVLGGETEQYNRIMENYRLAVEQKLAACPEEDRIKGLDICRKYYETYGKPMLEEKFPDYKDRIAVGLAGEGSDCFGLDDAYSKDHDWGPGFSMWLTDEDYEKTGRSLEAEYKKLPTEFMGHKRVNTPQGGGRLGVRRIGEFFEKLLGPAVLPKEAYTEEVLLNPASVYEKINWISGEEERFAAAVNGEVFRDNLGIFSAVRNLLSSYYPKHIRYLFLAQSAALFAQTGQYNFARMLKRKDTVAAAMEAMKGVRETLKIIHLLKGRYSLHDKWLFQGTDFSDGFEKLQVLLKKIAENAINPANESIFEEISVILTKRMYKDNYISDEDSFLQNHVKELLTKSELWKYNEEELWEAVIKAEFEAFDKVKNFGGRADCQDDFNTFHLMRKSQYMTWTKEMLIQYLFEFRESFAHGRNLIEEKYGRMMRYTAPEEYETIKDRFPYISPEKEHIINVIVKLQTDMMKEFAKEYPALANNARSVSSAEDNLYNTSSETYLKGEISTYSDKLLELYGRFLADYMEKGKNLSGDIIENTVKLYGYKSLEDAETKI